MASYIAQRGRKMSVMDRIKSIPGQMVDTYKDIGRSVKSAAENKILGGLKARDQQMKKQYERSQRPEVQAEAQRQMKKKEAILKAIKEKKGK